MYENIGENLEAQLYALKAQVLVAINPGEPPPGIPSVRGLKGYSHKMPAKEVQKNHNLIERQHASSGLGHEGGRDLGYKSHFCLRVQQKHYCIIQPHASSRCP